jgi:WD40 repeat protein
VVAGGYDGILRRYDAADCGSVESWQAHEGPIKAVAAFPTSDGGESSPSSPLLVVTAGKDKLLKTWPLGANKKGGGSGSSSQTARATLVGHENSVEAVAVRSRHQVLSGDWGGMLFFWRVDDADEEGEDGLVAAQTPAKKKRKGKGGEKVAAPATAGANEASPVLRLKAHAQCVSGIEWDPTAEGQGACMDWYGMMLLLFCLAILC